MHVSLYEPSVLLESYVRSRQGREEGDGDGVSMEFIGVGEEGPLPPGKPGGTWALEPGG